VARALLRSAAELRASGASLHTARRGRAFPRKISRRDRAGPWWQIERSNAGESVAALVSVSPRRRGTTGENVPRATSARLDRGRTCTRRGWRLLWRAHRSGQTGENGAGKYTARYQLTDVTGVSARGIPKQFLYTGLLVEGRRGCGGRSRREVYGRAEAGNAITGRWFDPDQAEEGGEWSRSRTAGSSRGFGCFRRRSAAGSRRDRDVSSARFGAKSDSLSCRLRVRLRTQVQRGEHDIRARLKVAADAIPGLRVIAKGGAEGRLAVYRQDVRSTSFRPTPTPGRRRQDRP